MSNAAKWTILSSDFNWTAVNTGSEANYDVHTHSKFDSALISAWDKRMADGQFRYSLEDMKFRRIPGRFNLVGQLNSPRGTNRRPPYIFGSLSEPFDPQQFNYNRISPTEVLFELIDKTTADDQRQSLIVINVSPIEKGHSLLIPFSNRQLPQILTSDAIELAVKTLLLSGSCRIQLVFNSLLAFASVNHLHFHLYYLAERLPLQQRLEVQLVSGRLHVLRDWMSSAFAFQLDDADLSGFVRSIFAAVSFLQQSGIAHNLVMSRAPKFGGCEDGILYLTAFLFPRKSISDTNGHNGGFRPAACEIGGHIMMFDEDFFNSVTEDQILEVFKQHFHLDNFEELLVGVTTAVKAAESQKKPKLT